MEYSEQLAELVGIMLGDGNIHNIHNRVTIVGSLEDKWYFEYHVIPLITYLFNIKPKLLNRNDRNAYYIHFYSKDVIESLLKIGLIRGNKSFASIPPFVFYNHNFMCCFLRGLFDTDGCLKFSKQHKQINYYPRIQLAFKPSPFANQIHLMLKKLNFKHGFWIQKRDRFSLLYYHISGFDNIHHWFTEICPQNQVQVSKYLFWKKYGYYIPKSSLSDRLNSLNLKIGAFY